MTNNKKNYSISIWLMFPDGFCQQNNRNTEYGNLINGNKKKNECVHNKLLCISV